MDTIKEQLKNIARSDDTYKKMGVIAGRYSLTLDLQDELIAETQDVIMGFKSSKDFTKNISSRLEINFSISSKIATDVNQDIFVPLRELLQKTRTGETTQTQKPAPVSSPIPKPLPTIQTPYKNPITSAPQPQPLTPKPVSPPPSQPTPIIKPTLEQAGRFTLEKPPVGFSSQYKTPTAATPNVALKGIEDPETKMIDHLLTTPVVEKEKTEVKKQVPESKPYTLDPYREEF